jgi:hypothetical protein
MPENDITPRLAECERLVTSTQAAALLGVSKNFLARDRWIGSKSSQGPRIPFVKVGPKAVRYALTDIVNHIRNRRVSSENHCHSTPAT